MVESQASSGPKSQPEYDLFLSHSSQDKALADSLCAALENSGVRCWIAPRDIRPGVTWSTAIMDAIEECGIMLVILSDHANTSPQVLREVSTAVSGGSTVIPFRTTSSPLSKDLTYFFSTPHWLDALTPPIESHIQRLVETVLSFLTDKPRAPAWSAKSIKGRPAPSFAPIEVAAEGEVSFDGISRTPRNGRFGKWLSRLLDDR